MYLMFFGQLLEWKNKNCATPPPSVKGFVYSVSVTQKPNFHKAFEHVPIGNNLKYSIWLIIFLNVFEFSSFSWFFERKNFVKLELSTDILCVSVVPEIDLGALTEVKWFFFRDVRWIYFYAQFSINGKSFSVFCGNLLS